MATAHTTGGIRSSQHDWEQIVARVLMTIWGGLLAMSGVWFLMNARSEGADTSTAVSLGITFLVASVPAFVAWRFEAIGGRLLVVASVLLAAAVGVIQFVGIQHGVMRNGAGEVNSWWVYGLGDVLFGLPAFVAGLLLLVHLHRHSDQPARLDTDLDSAGQQGSQL